MTNTNSPSMHLNHGLLPEACDDPDQFDTKDWVLRNVRVDDPPELRRNEFRHWAESAGFQNVEVRNLRGLTDWEMRFDRGMNAECNTPLMVERWVGYITRECRCQVEPTHFVAIVEGKRIATRFRLQPRRQPI